MEDKSLLFLKSALTTQNPFNSTKEVIQWLTDKNKKVHISISRIPFYDLKQWHRPRETDNLKHVSGRFFSIEGLYVRKNCGKNIEWTQPIINQPEVGFLGIITKEIEGVLYFLMQAKIEPGNVNYVQLSPTLQATKSNYTQVHHGARPLYLEYFTQAKQSQILLDQLQSEQGARFYRKRNRNIIIKIDEPVNVHEDFRWLTLGQIIKLTQINNTINMDTRTVISGISFGNYSSKGVRDVSGIIQTHESPSPVGRDMLYSAINTGHAKLQVDDHLSWLSRLKSIYELETKLIPLKDVQHWKQDGHQIYHEDNKYFRVIAVEVAISNREVKKWEQPLIEPVQEGLCAFVVKKINGVYHFIVQAKLEPGNFDIVELAPTVQCLTGNYKEAVSGKLPFLDYVLSVKKEQIIFDTLQSEEGGRFYREQNRNMLIEAEEDFQEELPDDYKWMTLNQLKVFLKFNNYLNIQARSLIAAISFL